MSLRPRFIGGSNLGRKEENDEIASLRSQSIMPIIGTTDNENRCAGHRSW